MLRKLLFLKGAGDGSGIMTTRYPTVGPCCEAFYQADQREVAYLEHLWKAHQWEPEPDQRTYVEVTGHWTNRDAASTI